MPDFSLCVWNINGWTQSNALLRTEIISKYDTDIFCLIDTHRNNHEVAIDVPHYSCIYHDRQYKHKRAGRASGGVAVLIKDTITANYTVREIDNCFEGVLGLEFTHKISKFVFIVYVCYLPP